MLEQPAGSNPAPHDLKSQRRRPKTFHACPSDVPGDATAGGASPCSPLGFRKKARSRREGRQHDRAMHGAGSRGYLPLWCRSLRPQPKATAQHIAWELGKSSELQTHSVGSKSQMIGAKEQGPKRACGYAPAYMMLARAFSPIGRALQVMSEGSVRRYVPEIASASAKHT
jgi:hypothetical protein